MISIIISQERSLFGILDANSEGRIIEFAEKPEHPKSNLASTGIYIFKLSALKKYLREDQRDHASDNDFGKNIIPKMVEDNSRVYAYEFSGYWKDVGTVRGFWQANMDLLASHPKIDLEDTSWPIYKSDHRRQAKLTHPPKNQVFSSRVGQDVKINGGRIEKSIISEEVTLGEKTEIKQSIIFPEANIADGTKIENAIIYGETKIQIPV